MLNTFLAVDLILMLKFPFKKKESRVPVYFAISLFICLTLTTSWITTLRKREDNGAIKPAIWVMVFAILVIVTQYVISIYSIFFAAVKLCRPGISKESRKLVLIRHILSIVLFDISQSYLVMMVLKLIFS